MNIPIWAWISGVVIVLLIGFIVLQRRKPEEADKIAAALDVAAKATEKKAQEAVDALRKK